MVCPSVWRGSESREMIKDHVSAHYQELEVFTSLTRALSTYGCYPCKLKKGDWDKPGPPVGEREGGH